MAKAQNNYLDLASESDAGSSGTGYDSDAHELSKTKAAGPRAGKRRRLSSDKEDYYDRISQLHSQDEDASSDDEEGDVGRRDKNAKGEHGSEAKVIPGLKNAVTRQKKHLPSDVIKPDAETNGNTTTTPNEKGVEEDEGQVLDDDGASDSDAAASDTEATSHTIKSPQPPPNDRKRKRKPSSPLLTTEPAPKPPKKALKTGILYLPTLPPFLKPSTLRSLLTPYTRHGLNRLFLTPEPHASRIARLRSGGNRKRLFLDGWVEFHSKRDAKITAETLNGQTMGGKKGGRWRDDVWSLRYLRGFKWGDLVGERRDEEAERGTRMEAERRREKREREAFVGAVQRGRVEKTREGKRVRRREKGDGGEEVDGDGDGDGRRKMSFRQNEVISKSGRGRRDGEEAVGGAHGNGKNEDVQRVLSKIF